MALLRPPVLDQKNNTAACSSLRQHNPGGSGSSHLDNSSKSEATLLRHTPTSIQQGTRELHTTTHTRHILTVLTRPEFYVLTIHNKHSITTGSTYDITLVFVST